MQHVRDVLVQALRSPVLLPLSDTAVLSIKLFIPGQRPSLGGRSTGNFPAFLCEFHVSFGGGRWTKS